MKYFVKSGDRIYGPVEDHKIERKIASGLFDRNCLISTDRKEWKVQPFVQRTEPVRPIRAAAPQDPPPPKIRMRGEPQEQPQVIKLSAADIAPTIVAPPQKRSLKWLWMILVIVGSLLALAATGAIIWVALSNAPWFKLKDAKHNAFLKSAYGKSAESAEQPPAKNFE